MLFAHTATPARTPASTPPPTPTPATSRKDGADWINNMSQCQIIVANTSSSSSTLLSLSLPINIDSSERRKGLEEIDDCANGNINKILPSSRLMKKRQASATSLAERVDTETFTRSRNTNRRSNERDQDNDRQTNDPLFGSLSSVSSSCRSSGLVLRTDGFGSSAINLPHSPSSLLSENFATVGIVAKKLVVAQRLPSTFDDGAIHALSALALSSAPKSATGASTSPLSSFQRNVDRDDLRQDFRTHPVVTVSRSLPTLPSPVTSIDPQTPSPSSASSTHALKRQPTLSKKGGHQCPSCHKTYKHPLCLGKHVWEHHASWETTAKLCKSKHQQVQLLEAAKVLVGFGFGARGNSEKGMTEKGALTWVPSLKVNRDGKESLDEREELDGDKEDEAESEEVDDMNDEAEGMEVDVFGVSMRTD